MRGWIRRSVVFAALAGALAGLAAMAGGAAGATQSSVAGLRSSVASQLESDQPGVQHLHFQYGPIQIQPGQNNITFSHGEVPKPSVDGYIVAIKPNIRRPDGTVPPVDVIHLHHGVWINDSVGYRDSARGDSTFFAAGEEKTTMYLPKGYGYPYKASDRWTINYMIHDLTPAPFKIFISYDLDFVPATAAAASQITPAHPIWMDVQSGEIYPVFDVLKGSGTNGSFTYPDQANDPYHGRRPKNARRINQDEVLIGTAGHLHPGGLHDDLWLDRPGAAGSPGSSVVKSKPDTAHLFRSSAHYYEPAGAVSWDVAMSATSPSWRVQVHKGDVLRVSTTYDTTRASWYESMGIMIVWAADQSNGKDPFATKVDHTGYLTHGHLPENNHHGGKKVDYADATKFAPQPTSGPVTIERFLYGIGDMTGARTIPEVKAGQQLTFVNADAPKGNGTWHSITACKAPCNRETGVAYPLANASVQFDSGQLGVGGAPTAGRVTWSTPADLPAGTYTYFCRIHPFMRGAFQVTAS